MNAAPHYSAAQLAALGVSARGVKKRLASIPAAGRTFARGQQALAWMLDQLPEAMRDELAAKARQGCYRDAAHLLADPGACWQPTIDGKAVALSEVAEHCIVEATKLERALSPTLKRIAVMPPLPAAEIETRGLAEYRAEFGHPVSAAHWHRLKNRTVERAGWRAEYSLEMFLPAKLARRATVAAAPANGFASGVHDLSRALSYVAKPTAPTAKEKAHVWDVAFCELAALVSSGTAEKPARRQVFRALADSGVRLAKSAVALEMAFSRNLARWKAGDCKPAALLDRRAGVRVEVPEKDRHLLIARSVEAGGRISQGFRTAFEAGELSAETAGRTVATPASKSYVPRRIREAIRHDVANLADMHHGPRQAKLNGAWIARDYSDIGPGDVFQLDDCTLPVYWIENTPEGETDMRGQLLLMVDVKTGMILGYALHSERNYNAVIIRRLIMRVHDVWGLPRLGLYLEKGIWKKSRLLKGSPADEITLKETEMGLREYVRFRHAELPRAKVVENILGAVQNLMEPEPGYVGRNEQVEKFERIQKKRLHAASGKIRRDSFLYTKDEWASKLDALFRQYNAERRHGRTHGLSPAEAYETGFDHQNPMVRLDGCARYLLTNHRRKEKVGKNGIRIVWHGQPFYYRSADTSRLRGREVVVWFDVESFPQSVTLTDLDHGNPVEVPRAAPVPSWTATPAELAAAHAQAAAHGEHQRTLYRTITPHLKRSMFRQVQADLNTALLGDAIEKGRGKVRARQDHEKEVARKTSALERELGVPTSKPGRDAESRLRSLELMKLAEEMEANEGSDE